MSLTSLISDEGAILALAVLSAAAPSAPIRRRVFSGALLFALARASLSLAGGTDWQHATLSPSYLAITAGLALLGIMLPLGAAAWAVRTGWRGWSLGVGVMAALFAAWTGGKLAATLGAAGGWGATLLAAAALTAAGAAFGLLVPRLGVGGLVRRFDRVIGLRAAPEPVPGPSDRTGRFLYAANAVAAILALWAAWLPLLLLVILVGGVTGVMLERRLAGRGLVPTMLLALLALAGVAYMLIHVAGDMPLTLAALTDAPYSDAFELLVALPALLAGWAMLRLWPFNVSARGPFTPLLGAALVGRIAVPLLPDGVAHWQPVMYPLAVLAAWHALAARRDAEGLGAFGALGLLSGTTSAGGWATLVVFLGAIVARPSVLRPRGELAAGWGRALPLLLAPGVLPVVSAALAVQVFYTTLAVAGLVALLWSKPLSALVDPAR